MPHAPSHALSARHQNVRRMMAERALDALVVTSLANVLYLTNFTGSSAIVVLTADRLLFLTDFRYFTAIADMEGAPHQCPGLEVIKVEGSYESRLAELLATMGPARVGFEAAHLSVSRHAWIEKAVGRASSPPVLTATEGVVEAARMVKDSYEIGVLREAARRLSRVAVDVFGEIARGRTEREIALAIDSRLRGAGFEKPAFDTIVAAGANAALPHAVPGGRKLTEGDLVVLDFGGVYDSYCVDLTRTVSVGPASERSRRVYAAVLEAHDRAVAAVRPDASRFAIDGAAREALGEAGMADAFGHSTGHGLGIDVHEDPKIGKRRPDLDLRDEVVTEGMVFTIEPGAYFPGWGGVRIEDDVLVTASGMELLTDVTTELLEL